MKLSNELVEHYSIEEVDADKRRHNQDKWFWRVWLAVMAAAILALFGMIFITGCASQRAAEGGAALGAGFQVASGNKLETGDIGDKAGRDIDKSVRTGSARGRTNVQVPVSAEGGALWVVLTVLGSLAIFAGLIYFLVRIYLFYRRSLIAAAGTIRILPDAARSAAKSEMSYRLPAKVKPRFDRWLAKKGLKAR